jgi:hypothetical protein
MLGLRLDKPASSRLVNYFRRRAYSRVTIDDVAGLPDRLASKVLSLRHLRRIGMQTLGPFLDVLWIKLLVVEHPAALERNRSRLVKRDKSQVRVHRPAA